MMDNDYIPNAIFSTENTNKTPQNNIITTKILIGMKQCSHVVNFK